MAWDRFAPIAFAMAPSSAAVERAFSLANNIFNEAQMSCLSDYVQTSLMLRNNKRVVG